MALCHFKCFAVFLLSRTDSYSHLISQHLPLMFFQPSSGNALPHARHLLLYGYAHRPHITRTFRSALCPFSLLLFGVTRASCHHRRTARRLQAGERPPRAAKMPPCTLTPNCSNMQTISRLTFTCGPTPPSKDCSLLKNSVTRNFPSNSLNQQCARHSYSSVSMIYYVAAVRAVHALLQLNIQREASRAAAPRSS